MAINANDEKRTSARKCFMFSTIGMEGRREWREVVGLLDLDILRWKITYISNSKMEADKQLMRSNIM